MKLQTLLKKYSEFERCLVRCDVHQLQIKTALVKNRFNVSRVRINGVEYFLVFSYHDIDDFQTTIQTICNQYNTSSIEFTNDLNITLCDQLYDVDCCLTSYNISTIQALKHLDDFILSA